MAIVSRLISKIPPLEHGIDRSPGDPGEPFSGLNAAFCHLNETAVLVRWIGFSIGICFLAAPPDYMPFPVVIKQIFSCRSKTTRSVPWTGTGGNGETRRSKRLTITSDMGSESFFTRNS